MGVAGGWLDLVRKRLYTGFVLAWGQGSPAGTLLTLCLELHRAKDKPTAHLRQVQRTQRRIHAVLPSS